MRGDTLMVSDKRAVPRKAFLCHDVTIEVSEWLILHYNDVIMGAITSQITSLTIVYPAVYSDANQRKHQSSASLAFVRGIHRGPVNSPHKGPVTRKMFPFDDVIMNGLFWDNRHRGPYSTNKPRNYSLCIRIFIVARSRKSLATLTLGSSKIKFFDDFTALALLRPLKL